MNIILLLVNLFRCVQWASSVHIRKHQDGYNEDLSDDSTDNEQHPHLTSLLKAYNDELQHHQSNPKNPGTASRTSGRRFPTSKQTRKGRPNQRREGTSTGFPENNNFPCRCGERLSTQRPLGRIVGGSEAKPKEFPWRCYIMNFELVRLCGGTIISHEYILTAAHCFKDAKNREKLQVVCGFHNYFVADPTGVARMVSQIIDHEAYNPITEENDISLLKVDPPLSFTKELHPICLPWKMTKSQFKGLTATASGWGNTRFNGSRSAYLKKVTLTTLPGEECVEYYENREDADELVTENNFCAYTPGIGTCQGDSGGSLDYKDSETQRYMNIGIVSWGVGCGRADSPAVFTKVTNYLNWISARTQGEALCRI